MSTLSGRLIFALKLLTTMTFFSSQHSTFRTTQPQHPFLSTWSGGDEPFMVRLVTFLHVTPDVCFFDFHFHCFGPQLTAPLDRISQLIGDSRTLWRIWAACLVDRQARPPAQSATLVPPIINIQALPPFPSGFPSSSAAPLRPPVSSPTLNGCKT